jgi:membrane associated rhomboid family serine protease
MHQASVGFQCPEELRGSGGGSTGSTGSRGGAGSPRPPRRVRNQFGGATSTNQRPVVTQALVALCVIAYLLQGAPGLGLATSGTGNAFTNRFFLSGYAIAEQHQYYRLLTAAFLHASLLHILFNMYALYLLGFQLEAVLGRVRFLALFIVSSIGGSALSFLVHGLQASSLGASTGIFGLFAAYYLIARQMRANTRPILVVVGVNLVLTFFVAGIDKFGHIGGLVTGAAIGVIFTLVPARNRASQAALVGGVFLLLVAAVLVKVSTVPDLFPSVPAGTSV